MWAATPLKSGTTPCTWACSKWVALVLASKPTIAALLPAVPSYMALPTDTSAMHISIVYVLTSVQVLACMAQTHKCCDAERTTD